jgi:peptide/nickel transport system ATP-binding protein
MDAPDVQARVLELLEQVRLPDPARVARAYPHQISGGQQQRVMIAMALGRQPSLLVLDEPTTALDVTTEAVVLDLLRDLVRDMDTAALYVSHNLGVVAGLTDRVAVLYASELVEDAPTKELYRQPLHPYTRGLLDSVPRLGQRKDVKPLQGIEGQIPSLNDLPAGCLFAPRCPLAIDQCWEERPPLDSPTPDRRVRCHRWPEILAGEVDAGRGDVTPIKVEDHQPETILAVDQLDVHYPLPRSIGDVLRSRPARHVKAVDDFNLRIQSRETLGVVGESGSGKTSLARALIGLVAAEDGSMELLGVQLPARLDARNTGTLAHLQMVFQNPEEALNPYLSIAESLRRPLRNLRGMSYAEAQAMVPQLLASVRLPAEYARRLPGQLSGGEKQRVAIARAFATRPDLLLADEPVSALDVSVQANILNLLAELQIENDSAMLFIAHDIAVVGYLADRIAVMYLGQLMQRGPAETIFDPPYHPYTEALLSAVPPPDPFVKQERIRLSGEVPSAADPPSGCPFHTRCPRFLGDICVDETPPWRETSDGKAIYCHIPIEELEATQAPVLRFNGEDD